MDAQQLAVVHGLGAEPGQLAHRGHREQVRADRLDTVGPLRVPGCPVGDVATVLDHGYPGHVLSARSAPL